MSMLKNAIDSIILGLEDFQSSDSRRLISCTRNLFAGILLLFKYKLVLLSPKDSDEVLIKQKVSPVLNSSEKLTWKGKGKKTLDAFQIEERFDSLGIEVDWKRVKEIIKYRNDIEHYYSELSKKSIESLISDTFLIIRDFISIHLRKDPKDELGDFAWDILLKVSEVYKREKQECSDKLNKLNWESDTVAEAVISFKCLQCGSNLISIKNLPSNIEESIFCCRACNENYDYENIVEKSLKEFYSFSLYLSYTDGDELELVTCPFCLKITYLYEEQICAICGETADHTCNRCCSQIIPEEISDEPYCSWCSHMLNKDD